MRLAMVTSRDHVPYHEDDAPLVVALRDRGIVPASAVWDAPDVAWGAFDAVLIRTPWDYYRRYVEFVQWLDGLEATGVRVVNPLTMLRWNADKRYLLDLAAAGVPVIVTVLLPRFGGAGLAEAVAATRADELVVKPVISGGAWRTLRFRADEVAALETEVATLRALGDLLLQPFLPEIESAGEWSLLFFGGEFSHAVLKRPRPGDFRVQEKHGGTHVHAEPGVALIDAARRCVDALPGIGHPGCLYARVDGVVVDDEFRLMELELIEPQLFLAGRPEAGARFADVLATALRAPSG